MTSPVNLNVVKWLQLCDAVEAAARTHSRRADLLAQAGRLTTVTLSPPRGDMIALTNALRWDSTLFGLADPADLNALAPGLLAKAALLRRMLSPEPARTVMAAPVPQARMRDTSRDLPPHPWMTRADIGGA